MEEEKKNRIIYADIEPPLRFEVWYADTPPRKPKHKGFCARCGINIRKTMQYVCKKKKCNRKLGPIKES